MVECLLTTRPTSTVVAPMEVVLGWSSYSMVHKRMLLRPQDCNRPSLGPGVYEYKAIRFAAAQVSEELGASVYTLPANSDWSSIVSYDAPSIAQQKAQYIREIGLLSSRSNCRNSTSDKMDAGSLVAITACVFGKNCMGGCSESSVSTILAGTTLVSRTLVTSIIIPSSVILVAMSFLVLLPRNHAIVDPPGPAVPYASEEAYHNSS
ncbi:glycoside hydrolase family 18 protein [Hydnum rufescens UP504]|uniref:Glycoside hydrolase family 18 protein n=1 Tax=Hydnum rufescens UP504 TaxID=1448309 RepID=A0A9P6B8D9_9AGAM|nr:glycoside hydrolase family 18 protein [Hydnum rufescens UP504]